MKKRPKERKHSYYKNAQTIIKVVATIFLVVLVAVVPSMYISYRDGVSEKFNSNVSAVQGVLELWNIDTFEGGSASKTSYLSSMAIEFEKQNKGLYIMVKNMTETEATLAISNGQMPAMFSFGTGAGEIVAQHLASIDNLKNCGLDSKFVSAGTSGGAFLAAAWCRSSYYLISTEQKLENSSQNTSQNLCEIAFVSGQTKTLKNGKTRTTYSLAFGGGAVCAPEIAILSAGITTSREVTAYSDETKNTSSYGAYCDFVEGKANILLGTCRDVARIENRITQGKIDGVIYQNLPAYCDMVQYLAISSSLGAEQKQACEKFIAYILSGSCQKLLSKIGLLGVSTTAGAIYESGPLALAENLADIKTIPSAFITKSELASQKAKFYG